MNKNTALSTLISHRSLLCSSLTGILDFIQLIQSPHYHIFRLPEFINFVWGNMVEKEPTIIP